MKKRLTALCLVLCMLAFPALSLAQAPEAGLTVLAAASLTDALTEIGAKYQQAHPGVKLTFSFAGSGTLQTQIEQGAPGDIFVSAAQKQMDTLAGQNLILNDTRVDLLENKVVLIVPKGKDAPASFETIGDAAVIAVGEPGSVPVGQYSMEIFETLGIKDALTKESGKLVYAKDVREVLTYVSTGNVDAGIVYATDALTDENVVVTAEAPEGSHAPVIYPAAVISSTKQEQAAREFLDYLAGEEAKGVFEAYGFTAVGKAEPAPTPVAP